MRTKRSMTGFASGLVLSAVVMLAGFVVTPQVLRWLGQERFGAARVLIEWNAYGNLFSLALVNALFPMVASALAKNEPDAVRRVIAGGVRMCAWSGALAFAAAAALAPWAPRILGVREVFAGDLRLAWIIGAAGLLLWPLYPFYSLTEALQRSWFRNALLAMQLLGVAALSVWFARAGWGIAGQACALVAGSLAFLLVMMIDAARRYPGIAREAMRERSSPELRRSLWKSNGANAGLALCQQIGILMDCFLVARWMGAAAVTPFSITQRLALACRPPLEAVGSSSYAALAELHARGEREIFRRRLAEVTKLAGLFGCIVLAPLAAYNEFFVGLWVGKQYYAGAWVTLFSSLNGYLGGVFSLWSWCLMGAGMAHRLLPGALAQAAIQFALGIPLTGVLGAAGPPLGTSISLAAVSAWYTPRLLGGLAGAPARELMWSLGRPLAFHVPAGAVLWWAARISPPRGWLDLAVQTGLAAAALLAASAVLFFSRAERTEWARRLRALARPAAAVAHALPEAES